MTTTQTHRSPNPKELDRLIPSRALPALLDFWTLCDFIGMRKDRSTRLFAWRGAKNGTFPAPVKVSEARISWKREEVERWLEDRPRAIYSKAKDADVPRNESEPKGASPSQPDRCIVTKPPGSCPDCGGKVAMVDSSGIYSCEDTHELGCAWVCIVGRSDAA